MVATLPPKMDPAKVRKAKARVFTLNHLRKTRPNKSEAELKIICELILNKVYKDLQQKNEKLQLTATKTIAKNNNEVSMPPPISTTVLRARKQDGVRKLTVPHKIQKPRHHNVIYYLNQGPVYKMSQAYPENMLWTIQNLCCKEILEKSKKKNNAPKRNRSLLDDYRKKKNQKCV